MSFAVKNESIAERIKKEARYICSNQATIRATAAFFGMSKSCVHKDVTERLRECDVQLYKEVKVVLEKNFAEKHLRGGEATKRKYSKRKSLFR